MKPINVSLGARSYKIHVAPLGNNFPAELRKLKIKSPRIFYVTTRALEQQGHVARLVKILSTAGFNVSGMALPNGEASKNLRTMEKLFRACVNARLDRASTIIGFGGGVVTDMAGFLAATYMRGISFVSIPTTLLGMVDAAIGGKTGVDLAEGKNLVGAFWQPKLVWIDPALLKTLPEKEWRTGFAEIIKYGVIGSEPFFNWLESRVRKNSHIQRWPARDVENAIAASAQMKARVVSADERETPLGGGREILNFGHTTGHALEAAFGFSGLTHGQAISIGMAVAGRIAINMNLGWQALDHDRMVKLLGMYGLPTAFPRLTKSQKKKFWTSIYADKKNVDGRLRFVLPARLGRVIVQSGIPAEVVEESIRELTI